MNDNYCVVTFSVTQHALIFEKKLKENNIGVKLMPVPRQLSASCGTAAYVNCPDKEHILHLCENNSIPIEEFHELEANKNDKWFLKYLKK